LNSRCCGDNPQEFRKVTFRIIINTSIKTTPQPNQGADLTVKCFSTIDRQINVQVPQDKCRKEDDDDEMAASKTKVDNDPKPPHCTVGT
jgi:hypothetical protein